MVFSEQKLFPWSNNEGPPFKVIVAITDQSARKALSAATGGLPGQNTDSLMQRGSVEIMQERLKSFVGNLFLFAPAA